VDALPQHDLEFGDKFGRHVGDCGGSWWDAVAVAVRRRK
jgi:hypothetical protein